jgi:AraC family transcriptional regulator
MFRPPSIAVKLRGCGLPVRMLRLGFSHEKFVGLTGHDEKWTLPELETGLGLGALCPSMGPLMQRLAAEVATPGFASAALVDGLATTAIVETARALRKTSDRLDEGGSLPRSHLRTIKERIADFSSPPPTVSSLAALCGISERHVLRLFRKETGSTLIGYIREARLEHAERLIGETELSLKEVAFKLGFSSQSSFTDAFRRETGVTPADYRRSCRRQYSLARPH